MNLLSALRSKPSQRDTGLVQIIPTWASQTEHLKGTARGVFLASPVVFSVVLARMKVFSEVRFEYRRYGDSELWSGPGLRILERPWPGGTTSELLSHMELDASLSGNAFVVRANQVGGSPDQLQILDPEKVEVVTDGKQKIGYRYHPDGLNQGNVIAVLLEDMAHWAPIPHLQQNWIGAAWVEAVLPEIRNDIRMTGHQSKFFTNAATPNLFVQIQGTMNPDSKDQLQQTLQRRYSGWENAYKTLVMDQGADMKVVGSDFQQMDFVNVQKSNEGRISSAGGVPPIIVSFKAGLDAATYSNYGLAMRAFADHQVRPSWNSVTGALQNIVRPPNGSELWYNDRNVAALRQDAKDAADIKKTDALTLEALIRAGYTPDSAVDAVVTGDITRLEHTGLTSVQLLPPGEDGTSSEPDVESEEDTEEPT